MDYTKARAWLDAEWEAVLSASNETPDAKIDRVANSKVQSVRYAAMTQLLGKILDQDRGILCFQSETGKQGAWDARSFCSSVIVPWVADNQDVLGKSPDPYVSNPLRRPVLSREMPGTRKADSKEWAALFDWLAPLDEASQKERKLMFRRLLQSLARRLAKQTFRYPIPMRVSPAQTRAVLEAFLAESSGGLRPMAVATALMKVIGRAFHLFARVESQGVTEADAASGVPGDVMCYDENGGIALAVEVKDRNITLADVRSTTAKIRSTNPSLANFLFAAPDIQSSERSAVDDAMERAWGSGLNFYRVDLLDLATSCFALLNEDWRLTLLHEVGEDLDRRGDHKHRRAWLDKLSDIGAEEEQT